MSMEDIGVTLQDQKDLMADMDRLQISSPLLKLASRAIVQAPALVLLALGVWKTGLEPDLDQVQTRFYN